MKFAPTIFSLIIVLTLSACGGGSGSSSTNTSTANRATPVVPIIPTIATTPTAPTTAPTEPIAIATPPVLNPINPYTGQPASGQPISQVSGIVVNNLTVGATVTAYVVQADGSNGTVLGTSSLTDADGKFTMQLASAPTGMVRFVAKGGWFISEADGSKQAHTATELVTPFITTDLNFFVITPATHIVSHLMPFNAKAGNDLPTSYLYSFGFLMW